MLRTVTLSVSLALLATLGSCNGGGGNTNNANSRTSNANRP